MNLLVNYELFLAKIITFIMIIAAIVIFFCSFRKRKNNTKSNLKITLLKDNYQDIKNNVLLSTMENFEKKYG